MGDTKDGRECPETEALAMKGMRQMNAPQGRSKDKRTEGEG